MLTIEVEVTLLTIWNQGGYLVINQNDTCLI